MYLKSILLSTVLFAVFHSGAQECKSLSPVVSIHYVLNGKQGFSSGFEAGYIGHHSPFGYAAGFQVEFFDTEKRISDQVAKETGNLFRLYIKGSYRIFRNEQKRSISITTSPEIDMNSGFDFRTGIRFLFPLNQSLGIGLEPDVSVLRGNFASQLQVFYRL